MRWVSYVDMQSKLRWLRLLSIQKLVLPVLYYYKNHYISRFTTKLKDWSGNEGALQKLRSYVCRLFGKGKNKGGGGAGAG